MPGASAVLVQPPNVVAMPAPPSAPAQPQQGGTPGYRSVTITSLSRGGTIHSNTGAFEFSVRSVPALRPGDRFKVVLDGTLLATGYRGTQLRVTEADWNRAARAESTEHELRVAIVDAQGAILIASDAIGFYVQRATVGGRRR
jgi:Mg-chelatase subunit ChlD